VKRKQLCIPMLFCIILLMVTSPIFQVQANPTPTPTPPTTISREQAVQIALQKAQTITVLLPVDNTSHASGLTVNPIPKQVLLAMDIDIRYKWLITFNVNFASPVGNYRSGTIGFMIAADTGEIEHFNVLDSQSMAGMGLELQIVESNTLAMTPAFSPSPTATPSPTYTPSPSPTYSPTQEPTTEPSPSPSIPEFPAWTALPLILAAFVSVLVYFKRRKL
jgi:hypothetical protein